MSSPSAGPVLVTGATGFIGTHLLDRLEKDGLAVWAATRNKTNRYENYRHVTAYPIRSIETEQSWPGLDAVDAVVHLAARVHVMDDTAVDPLQAYRAVNVDGTCRLARQAAAAGVRRMVFVSTIKVVGEASRTPLAETGSAGELDPYGRSKLEAETELRRIAARTGLEVVILRPPLLYGPGVKANFLKLMKLAARNWPLPLAAVDNRRSMLYVGNLVDAIATCLHHPQAANQTFHVCDGEDLATPELIRRLAAAQRRKARLVFVPLPLLRLAATLLRRQAVMDRLTGSLCVDSRKIQTMLDWAPPFTVDHGLTETTAWFEARSALSCFDQQVSTPK